MRRLVLFVALSALLAPPSQSQTKGAPPNISGWTKTATSASAVKAGVAIPLSAGTLKKTELRQYDGDGADLSARYETPDRAIQGTFFLSAPTLPDIGLSFLATDEVLRRQWGPATHITADRLLPVAGVKAAERRVVYEGANVRQKPLISIATFVRAGSWVIVGWMTGPAGRADEINRDLDALIAGMAFAKGSEPLPAKVIKTEQCEPRDRTINARGTRATQAEVGEFVLTSQSSIVDEKENSALNPMRRTPDRLCLESIEIDGDVALQIYRPVDKSDRPFSSRLFALFGNSGVIVEIAESQKEPGAFYVLRHGVGRMYAFGKFDREPSIAQIRALSVAPDKQPAFALFTSRFITPSGAEDFTIYCARTVEGCPAETPKTPEKPQSSR
jgi:hypothetical protein